MSHNREKIWPTKFLYWFQMQKLLMERLNRWVDSNIWAINLGHQYAYAMSNKSRKSMNSRLLTKGQGLKNQKILLSHFGIIHKPMGFYRLPPIDCASKVMWYYSVSTLKNHHIPFLTCRLREGGMCCSLLQFNKISNTDHKIFWNRKILSD